MKSMHAFIQRLVVLAFAASASGCAELKVGAGPFKAGSVEIGPGGVEAEGPSAGPFKTKSAEIGPGGAEVK